MSSHAWPAYQQSSSPAESLTGSNARSTADFDVAVIYERQIDIPAERERLTKDLAKYEKGLASADKQLNNETFMPKPPPHHRRPAQTIRRNQNPLRQNQIRPRRSGQLTEQVDHTFERCSRIS